MEKLKESIFKFLHLDNLMANLTGYVETKAELLKIEVREEIAKILSRGLVLVTVIVLASIFLLFFSVGLAHYLNGFFEHPHIGYWIVAGIYGLPCIVFLFFRKTISTALEKYFAKHIKHKEK
jgi:uncharacterized membrane protein